MCGCVCAAVFTPVGTGGSETRWETLFQSADTLILKLSGYQTHQRKSSAAPLNKTPGNRKVMSEGGRLMHPSDSACIYSL